MKFKYWLMALAAGCMIAPTAMAKTSGGLRIKHVKAVKNMKAKGKKKSSRKSVSKPAPAPAPEF